MRAIRHWKSRSSRCSRRCPTASLWDHKDLLNALDTEAQILSDEEDELIEQVVTSDGTIHPAALREDPGEEDEDSFSVADEAEC
jgi:hypothetical protein